MATIFDHFDRIRIINLPHRKDRRREMEDQLAKAGLLHDPRVEFFNACIEAADARFYSAGAKGAFKSHMEIIHEAAVAGESVLILEDDCDFAGNLDQELPANWDVFYGGYEATSLPFNPAESDIVGAHCMGFNKRVLPRLQTWLRLGAWKSDNPAPIDGEYVRFRRANSDLATVFAEPQIAVQRASRTDIGKQRWFDRTPILRSLAGLTRRAIA